MQGNAAEIARDTCDISLFIVSVSNETTYQAPFIKFTNSLIFLFLPIFFFADLLNY